jgi:hypothetical protein
MDLMKPGGVIMLEQSVAHWHPKFATGTEDDHRYVKKVSPDKYKGEKEQWKLHEEMKKRGLRYYVKVSPIVENSRNVAWFHILDKKAKRDNPDTKTIDDLQKNVSARLGIPAYSTVDALGLKSRQLLASNYPSGYVELYEPNMFDAPSLLDPLMGPRENVDLDTFKLVDDGDDETHGIGRMLIRPGTEPYPALLDLAATQSIAALALAPTYLSQPLSEEQVRAYGSSRRPIGHGFAGNASAYIFDTMLQKGPDNSYEGEAEVFECEETGERGRLVSLVTHSFKL